MTDIFNEQPPVTPAVVPATPTIQIPDEASEWIGEGKKYGDIGAALKALPHSQKHISTLENELKEVREALAKERAFGESVTAMSGNAATKATPVDEAALTSIIDRRLQEKALVAQAEANVAEFRNAMASKFGEKAKEVFATKAQEIGVSVEFLTDVVKKSATAGKELFGLKNDSRPTPPVGRSSINTEALTNQGQPLPHKTVMGGATTSDMVNAWRRAGEAIKNK